MSLQADGTGLALQCCMNFGASFVISILLMLSQHCLAATGEVYYQPSYPDFSDSTPTIEFIDDDLQTELLRFSVRKERDQKIYEAWVPDDGFDRQQSDHFVLRRLVDKGAKRIMKSRLFKSSELGQASEGLKQKMQTDIQFSDEKNMNHKFDFKIELFQGYAQIQYTGFTRAKLRYQMNDSRVMMVFEHSLSKYQTMAIETALTGAETSQFVTLNCRW